MTDEHLIAMCNELRDLRDQLRTWADREKRIAGDVVAELLVRKLDFFEFDPAGRRRADLEIPVTHEVDEDRFIAACRDLVLETEDVAACFTRRISVTAARKLVGDQVAFDSLCNLKRGQPRVRIVTLE